MDAARTRAYVSLRFVDSADSNNAAIAVVDLTGGDVEPLSILEVGEELGRPVLVESSTTGRSRRLLYVPDIRSDSIWVIDASTDVLKVVHQISGRLTRPGATPERVRLLDAPSTVVFAERGDRRLGFVSNFSNSTMAILDASDPDPRNHEIVARLGEVLLPDGTNEEEE